MKCAIAKFEDVEVFLSISETRIYGNNYLLKNDLTGTHNISVDPANPHDIFRLATHINGYLDNVKKAVAELPKVEITAIEGVLNINFNDGKRIYLTKKEYSALKRKMLK